jgi:hypothetical protein
MQGQAPAGGTSSPPNSGKSSLATVLAAIALAVAIAALAVSFVASGHTGAKGPAGTAGQPGQSSEVYWAYVNSTGVLLLGNQATGSELLFAGAYQVNFTENVSACAFTATLGNPYSEGQARAGSVTVAGRDGAPDAVWVQTWNAAGGVVDEGFNLAVTCNAGLWAVVSSGGALVRGSGAVSASQPGGATGQYQVIFPQDVTNCTYAATLGTTGSLGGVPPGVATVAGRTGEADGVYVATYNATGVATNSSFHLVVECASATMAVVSSTGGYVRGDNNATSGAGGGYDVGFPTDVQDCAYIATIGETGSSGSHPAALVTVAGEDGYPNGVYVATFDLAGSSTPESFHLIVFC